MADIVVEAVVETAVAAEETAVVETVEVAVVINCPKSAVVTEAMVVTTEVMADMTEEVAAAAETEVVEAVEVAAETAAAVAVAGANYQREAATLQRLTQRPRMVLRLLRIRRAIQAATTITEAAIRIHTVIVGETTILFQQPTTMARVTPIMVVVTAIAEEVAILIAAVIVQEEVVIRIAVDMILEEASARVAATLAVVVALAAVSNCFSVPRFDNLFIKHM
ncbi:hypothetical protein GGF49_005549 [Coemansia sp. RSA 1853]|nr:hypothetical protein GGF49_005549 [Coemansia sp. RSA 1853]